MNIQKVKNVDGKVGEGKTRARTLARAFMMKSDYKAVASE